MTELQLKPEQEEAHNKAMTLARLVNKTTGMLCDIDWDARCNCSKLQIRCEADKELFKPFELLFTGDMQIYASYISIVERCKQARKESS